MDYSIYVIDDEQTIRDGISFALEEEFTIRTFSTAEAAIDELPESTPDVILLDIGLPGMNGLEALERIKNIDHDILIIMITAYEDIDTVVSAMKLGAFDYVVKPIRMDTLEMTLKRALESLSLKKEVLQLQEKYIKDHLPGFIGESDVIQDVMEFISTVARSPDTPILILGETGTGKELIASAIHYRSPLFKGPFVTINCAALPNEIIESELFGYERGAFSGAHQAGKKGLLEAAAGGTLFLDEVGDLGLEAQAKLLRFLDSGEYYHLGSTQKRHIRTRVISATNRDITALSEKGEFRQDLLFRLGVIQVKVPSLNERKKDILPLAKHFIVTFNKKFRKEITGLSDHAQETLLAHEWTGNVRELRNIIERGVLVAQSPLLTIRDLWLGTDRTQSGSRDSRGNQMYPHLTEDGVHFDEILKDFERAYLEEAFTMADGNESKAAKLLKMNHHTYRYRLKKIRNS